MLEKKRWQAVLFVIICCLEFITIEVFLGRNLLTMSLVLWGKNIVLLLAVNGVFASLCHWLKPVMLCSAILVLVIGIANYFVQQFRGYGIVFMDFYAFRTAAVVAGNYSYHVNSCFAAGTVCGLATAALCLLFPAKQTPYFTKKAMLTSAGGLAVCGFFFLWVNTSGTFFRDVSTLTWDHRIGIHDYGYPLYFLASAGVEEVSPPSGYSPERVEEILSRYALSPEQADPMASVGESAGKQPNLIMIMNESFADLHVLGDFDTNQPITPFWDSMKKNTTRGYALSSVYGGYTSNSEFEFLTGCTKAFLPGNPYLQYITSPLPSLMQTLKSQESYRKAIALHPYYSSGYNRNRVYPLLSFDEFLTLDDFSKPELVREYVSDQENYQKIIELYETKKAGTPLCVFNVTMQNHSPYTASWSANRPVQVTSFLADEPVNQYLSLLKLSDDAWQQLVSYFQHESEPTILFLFGDHQPHLPDRFYQKVMGKIPVQFSSEEAMKQYFVPFMIWANFDIPEQDVETTSLNYLATLLLQTAGIELNDYQRFLLAMRQQLPAISANGYLDADGKLHSMEDAEGECEKWLKEYEMVQYNYLFDEENRLDQHYGISVSDE